MPQTDSDGLKRTKDRANDGMWDAKYSKGIAQEIFDKRDFHGTAHLHLANELERTFVVSCPNRPKPEPLISL